MSCNVGTGTQGYLTVCRSTVCMGNGDKYIGTGTVMYTGSVGTGTEKLTFIKQVPVPGP